MRSILATINVFHPQNARKSGFSHCQKNGAAVRRGHAEDR
jgi:hypothetical protein